jgi:hypothetical protein
MSPETEVTAGDARRRATQEATRWGNNHMEPAGPLEDWQEAFAAKPVKDIVDYAMLVPGGMFACEDPEPVGEAGRRARITLKDVASSYIELRPEWGPRPLQLARYRGVDGGPDLVVGQANEGMGSMCNKRFVQEWTEHGWKLSHALDAVAIDAEVDGAWWLNLPRRGTATSVIDADGNVLLELQWADGQFHLPTVDKSRQR